MVYALIDISSIILYIFMMASLLLALLCFSNKRSKLGTAFVVLTVILLVGDLSILFNTPSKHVVNEYIAVNERHQIDFFGEDLKSHQVVYAYDGEQFFIKRDECEIVVIDEGALQPELPAQSNSSVLPCMEKYRTVIHKYYEIMGHRFSRQPEIEDKIYFYVPKSYLDNSDLDWTLLFENNN